MQVVCAVCEKSFEGKTSRAKFCGATCRQRAARGVGKESDGPLVTSVRADLDKAGVGDTYEAQLALALAKQITAAGPTGISGLSKELRTVMTAALGPKAPAEPTGSTGVSEEDVEDEVQKAREARELKARNAAG